MHNMFGLRFAELILNNAALFISSASGVLKGFDPLLNLVLDGTIEYMRGEWQQTPPWSVLYRQVKER